MEITKDDLKSIIRDAVGPVVAERMKELEDRWKAEDGARTKSLAEQFAAVAKAGTPAAQRRATEGHDPHNGKALNFARAVKALAVARMDGLPYSAAPDVAKRWGDERVAEALLGAHKKALAESVFADGGALVPEEFSSEFIELLRAAAVVESMGLRPVPMKGSLTMGRQNSAGSASYLGENQNITKSQPTVAQLTLSAKKLAGLVPISNDLLRNPAAGAEAFVRDDLVAVMNLAKDLYLLRGTGTQYSPKGVRYWANASNINAISAATLAGKIADLVQAIRLVEQANVPEARRGWVLHPRTKWALASTTDSNGNFVFLQEMMRGMLFGFPFRSTTQVPINLGGGTESEIYFGEWSQGLLGEDTNLNVEVFPNGAYHDGSSVVSGISADQTVIRAIARHDFVVRHDTAFAVITGVTY